MLEYVIVLAALGVVSAIMFCFVGVVRDYADRTSSLTAMDCP